MKKIQIGVMGSAEDLNYGIDALECAKEIGKEIAKSGNILVYGANVGDQQSVQNMVNYTISNFGEIDVLINNAGISCSGLLQDISFDEWNSVISTNLTGTYNLCKCVLPEMINKKRGKIILRFNAVQ